jgi:hypothetical protein
MVFREATIKEVSVDATQTPPQDHPRFDRLCSEVEEFDYLPAAPAAALVREPAEPGEQPELDQLILAGLVSPA